MSVGASASASGAKQVRGTVLVIDDCTTVRTRLRDILEEQGYHVLTAPDGLAGLEEARRRRPDAILVDFVMPRMNGYQFCQELLKSDELRTVPVVLMSVKVDRIGEQFVRHGLADDALSKPFQPAALRAVLAHRVGKPSRRTERQAEAERKEEAAPAPPPSSLPPPPDEEWRRRTVSEALERARELLLARLANPLAVALVLTEPEMDAVRRGLLEGLTDQTLWDLAAILGGLGSHAGPPSFSGTIAALPVGEVFLMLAHQNATGVMEIEGPDLRARIFFSGGKVDLSRLDGGDGRFRLGNYLANLDLVALQDIDRVAEIPEMNGTPLGERLVKLGLISREELRKALQMQAEEIFYEVLRWTNGTYRFRPHALAPEATSAALAIPVSGLLMEGYRRVDEWRLVEREIKGFDEVYECNPAAIEEMESAALSTEEKLVLDHVNGSSSISDIVRALRLDSFQVCRILYRLLSMKIVRRRRPAAAPGGRSGREQIKWRFRTKSRTR